MLRDEFRKTLKAETILERLLEDNNSNYIAWLEKRINGSEPHNEINPCPLCGSIPEFEYMEYDPCTKLGDDGTGWLKCPQCKIAIFEYRDIAIEMWNELRVTVNKCN